MHGCTSFFVDCLSTCVSVSGLLVHKTLCFTRFSVFLFSERKPSPINNGILVSLVCFPFRKHTTNCLEPRSHKGTEPQRHGAIEPLRGWGPGGLGGRRGRAEGAWGVWGCGAGPPSQEKVPGKITIFKK